MRSRRVMLSFVDHEYELRQLAQRQPANVSFHTIIDRGLTAFDDPIGPVRPATRTDRAPDRAAGRPRAGAATDGAVVLNTNDVRGATARMMAASLVPDEYYSITPARWPLPRITVRVSASVEVRARPVTWRRPSRSTPAEAHARAPGGRRRALPWSRRSEMITPRRGNLPVRIGRGRARLHSRRRRARRSRSSCLSGPRAEPFGSRSIGIRSRSQTVTSADAGARSIVIITSGVHFRRGVTSFAPRSRRRRTHSVRNVDGGHRSAGSGRGRRGPARVAVEHGLAYSRPRIRAFDERNACGLKCRLPRRALWDRRDC